MAFELGKLYKFAPFVAIYAFYNVFATNYPADPLAGMRTALTAFAADPIGKLKTKTQNFIMLGIVIIGLPILLKSLKLPASVKMIVNVIAYYIIGDQVAALLAGPGRFGAVGGSPLMWSGPSSAFHQNSAPVGVIRNVYGGN